MVIRPFHPSDVEPIARLFHDTVRRVNRGDYSERQVKAWAPDDIFFRDWAGECARKHTYVAEEQGALVGFAELEPGGYIDCFYVHHNWQGQGVGSALYGAIEKKARTLGIRLLFADVSISARPFFEARGFTAVREQTVTARGVSFVNCHMDKRLK